MKRRLLNMTTAISLVLFLATLAVWIRSYWSRDVIVWASNVRQYAVVTNRGIWSVDRSDAQGSTRLPPVSLHFVAMQSDGMLEMSYAGTLSGDPPRVNRRIMGIRYLVQSGSYVTGYQLLAPIWLLAAAFAILPAVRLTWYAVHFRRRRRELGNLCKVCGYDLRATPERCPECGNVPSPAKENAAPS